MQALATYEGGAIDKKKVRKRSPKQKEKIMEALASEKGGAIDKKKVRKRSPKQKEKIMEALATEKGGSMSRNIKFHDKRHKYLYEKLSGRGGGFDSPECRKMMYNLMKHSHPSVWNSYIKGKAVDIHKDPRFHLLNAKPPVKQDRRNHITNYGGSMRSLTHSENGMLRAHDHSFHHEIEIV